MNYRAEAETLEGEMLIFPATSLAEARRKAATLSREHITAYAVATQNGEAVGHIAYGEGRRGEVLGRMLP